MDPKFFAVVERTRTVDTDIEEDPRYTDVGAQTEIIRMARLAAVLRGRTLTNEHPIAGWVRDRNGSDEPCRQNTDGARPVWIWWAE